MSDFLRDYNFKVYIGGFANAGFAVCKGLSGKTLFTEYKEGGALAPVPLFSGFQFEPLILSRGLTRTDSDAYFWWESAAYMDTIANLLNKRNIIVESYENKMASAINDGFFTGGISTKPPVRYKISGACVESVSFGEHSSMGENIIVVQNIVLRHSGIERLQLAGGLL